MQVRFVAIIMLLLIVPALAAAGGPEFSRRVYSQIEGDSWARSGMIPFELLLERLAEADVVFLGEYHGDFNTHKMQLEIFQALAGRRRGRVSLTMEQFERDVQPVLEDYINNNLSEDEFLAASRPWPNYDPDYRRLVEYAKSQGLHVMAANVPRPLASAIAKDGFEAAWAAYTNEERAWIAESTTHEKDMYWDNFYGIMGGGHGEGLPEETIMNYFAAQCVKDDTMAESIARLRQSHPDRSIVHTNGSFHCDYRLGTVSRLAARRPDDRIIVVAIRPADWWSQATLNAETQDYNGAPVPVADYIVYVAPSTVE